MRKTFIMTAMATVLAFQVAVADDMQSNKRHLSNQKQHKLAKTSSQANKVLSRSKISLDLIVDFQFAMPENASRYKNAKGDNYVKRLYEGSTPPVLITDPSGNTDPTQVIKDHDGGILGIYSKDYYYNVNNLINFKIEVPLLNDMSIGAVSEVLTPVSNHMIGSYSIGAKSKGAYLFIKTPYFRAQAGSMVGAEQMLKIDSASWSAADGGVNGNWINYANLEGNYVDAVFDSNDAGDSTRHRDVMRPFYVTPALYSQYISNDATFSRNEDVSIAPKISVYSNEMSGVQVGVSYAPNHVNASAKSGLVPDKKLSPVYSNVIGYGARYEKALEDFAVKISVAGEMGDAIKKAGEKKTSYYDLSAMSIGGSVNYNNMATIGGEYGYLGKSGLPKEIVKDEDLNKATTATTAVATSPDPTYYWTIGGAYDIGPVRISGNYYTSCKNPYSSKENDASTLQDFNIGTHYNFYRGKNSQFTPYAAYHHFITKERIAKSGDTDITSDSQNNTGHLFMIGVKAVF
ncbi:MAG: hypothetical protein HRK26_01330 [Rickettsiaceae bacterium H1]|nr:hypothetical protein [Rickettsiaceae bacterium H1]